MDGLGQGVSKILDKPTFVSKTLPDEQGLAVLTGQRKKVAFAHLASPSDLDTPSPSRIHPVCPHFDQCPGCHYLHTTYPMELQFKQEALCRELQKLKIQTHTPEIHASCERFGYRNRLTLHYDKSQNSLGIFSSLAGEILPIPQCLLPIPEIQKIVTALYTTKSWQNFDGPNQGHLEIYQHPMTGMQTSVNLPYAHLGFSQVHESMNHKLTAWLSEQISQHRFTEKSFIVDLFGGDGNLSKEINLCPTIYVVDKYSSKNFKQSAHSPQQFFSYDLYDDHELRALQKNILKKTQTHQLEIMILDPPRSGFTKTAILAHEWKPTHIYYVSCAPDTLMRDTRDLLSSYSIQDIQLFDMFPGTFHFETVIHLQRL